MTLLVEAWEEHTRDAYVRAHGYGWLVDEAARQRQFHGVRVSRLIRQAALADEYGIDDDVIDVDAFVRRLRKGAG